LATRSGSNPPGRGRAGVNLVKVVTTDGRFVPGAGAFEIELARQIAKTAEQSPGLDQYAIRKFAEVGSF
jgi:T-complex protein 1 subunit theta